MFQRSISIAAKDCWRLPSTIPITKELCGKGCFKRYVDTGFEIAAIYPVHGGGGIAPSNGQGEYLIRSNPRLPQAAGIPDAASWAGIRQEVRRRARAELAAIEAGRYGGKPLAEPDVRLICIGKCLELYSAHYDRVLDHEGKIYPLHKALADISSIVDQLVTRERPLPPELEEVDAHLCMAAAARRAPARGEHGQINKGTRALQVSTEDLKKAGLIIRGRTGRGRTYEVKQPNERLEALVEKLRKDAYRWRKERCSTRLAAEPRKSAAGGPASCPHRIGGCERIGSTVARTVRRPTHGNPRGPPLRP